jgi:hypothetical protein
MPQERLALQAKLGKKLRDIFSDIASEPSPFDHLLPPDRPPPGAPGLREPAILRARYLARERDEREELDWDGIALVAPPASSVSD